MSQLLELIRKMITYPSARISAIEAISEACFRVVYVKFDLNIPLTVNSKKPHFINIYTKEEFDKLSEPVEDGVEPVVPAFEFRLGLLGRKLFAFDKVRDNLYVIELISKDGLTKVSKEVELLDSSRIVISFDNEVSLTNIEVLDS